MSTNEHLPHGLAEGARYALLRRLAPALRHEAVAPLQPIAMATSVLERRLRDPAADPAQVHDAAARLAGLSRAAVQSCLGLIAWLAPEPARLVPLHEAVRETLDLLRGSFAFRGLTLHDELPSDSAAVHHLRLRFVLPACLLWLTDSAGAPAEVTLRAQSGAKQLRLLLDVQPVQSAPSAQGLPGIEDTPVYRPLREDEVRALAADESIGLESGVDTLVLTLDPAYGLP